MGLERLIKPWAPKGKKFHSDAASPAPLSLAGGSAGIPYQLAERSLPALYQHGCLQPQRELL